MAIGSVVAAASTSSPSQFGRVWMLTVFKQFVWASVEAVVAGLTVAVIVAGSTVVVMGEAG